jgi:pimeloyl-ACP methyl ester carboxylesterase
MTRHDTPCPPPSAPIHAVLVPGWWLGAWAWDAVGPGLRSAGITPHPVTLPGLDGTPARGITFDDHVDAVVGLIDDLSGDIVLVGHSGGGAVVHAAADRRPRRIRRVVHVDTGPPVDGEVLRPGAVDDLPFPTDDELVDRHLSTDGLDADARAEMRRRAVAHPGGVVGAPVRLTDPARLEIPTTVVCTSLPSAILREMLDDGRLASDLTETDDVRYVDLPTGHWPMLSRPTDLAEVLAREILGPDHG